jgi:hypothetical protein
MEKGWALLLCPEVCRILAELLLKTVGEIAGRVESHFECYL